MSAMEKEFFEYTPPEFRQPPEVTNNPLGGATEVVPPTPQSMMIDDPSRGGGYNMLESEFNSYVEQDVKMFDALDIDKQRAENQGFGEEALGFVNQLIVGTAGEFVSAAGYLMDMGSAVDAMNGGEAELGNWLANVGNSISDWTREATPIYEKSPGKFNPGDSAFWFNNGVSIGSALSIALPGLGVIKALRAAGKFGRGLAMAGKLGVRAKEISNLVKIGRLESKVLSGIGQAAMATSTEAMMEANSVFESAQERYKGMIDPETNGYFTPEKIKKIASEEASDVYRENWALFATNLPQYLMLMKGGTKGLLNVAGTPTVSKRLKMFKTLGTGAFELSTEAMEEVTQHIFTRNAEDDMSQSLGLIDDQRTFGQRVGQYLSEDAAKTSALFGAAGAGVFTALMSAVNYKGEKAYESRRQQEIIRERESRTERFMLMNSLANDALSRGDNETFEEIQDLIIQETAMGSAAAQNAAEARDWLANMSNLDEESAKKLGLPESFKENLDKNLQKFDRVVDDYAKNVNKYGYFAGSLITSKKFKAEQQQQALNVVQARIADRKKSVARVLGNNPKLIELYEKSLEVALGHNMSMVYTTLEDSYKADDSFIGERFKRKEFESWGEEKKAAEKRSKEAADLIRTSLDQGITVAQANKIRDLITAELIRDLVKEQLLNMDIRNSEEMALILRDSRAIKEMEMDARNRANKKAKEDVKDAKSIEEANKLKDGTNDDAVKTAIKEVTKSKQANRNADPQKALGEIDLTTAAGQAEATEVFGLIMKDASVPAFVKGELSEPGNSWEDKIDFLKELIGSAPSNPEFQGLAKLVKDYYSQVVVEAALEKIAAIPNDSEVVSIVPDSAAVEVAVEEAKEVLEEAQEEKAELIKVHTEEQKELDKMITGKLSDFVNQEVIYLGKRHTLKMEGVRFVLESETQIVELAGATGESTFGDFNLKLPEQVGLSKKQKREAFKKTYKVELLSEGQVRVNGIPYAMVVSDTGTVTGLFSRTVRQMVTNERMLIAVEIERNKTEFKRIMIETSPEQYQKELQNSLDLTKVDAALHEHKTEELEFHLNDIMTGVPVDQEGKSALSQWTAKIVKSLQTAFVEDPRNATYLAALGNIEALNTLIDAQNNKPDTDIRSVGQTQEKLSDQNTSLILYQEPAPIAVSNDLSRESTVQEIGTEVVQEQRAEMSQVENKIEVAKSKLDKINNSTDGSGQRTLDNPQVNSDVLGNQVFHFIADQDDIIKSWPLVALNFHLEQDAVGNYSRHKYDSYGADHNYINDPKTLKPGTKLYVEVDLENNPFNKVMLDSNPSEEKVAQFIEDRAALVYVHYIDGNTNNISPSNRKVVGLLKGRRSAKNTDFPYEIRKRFADEYRANPGIQTKAISSFTVAVDRKFAGDSYSVKGTNKNPIDVLQGKPLILAYVNIVDGKKVMVVPNQPKINAAAFKSSEPALGMYLIVPAANGDLIPHKLWVNRVDDLPNVQGSSKTRSEEAIEVLKTADASNYQAVLNKAKEIAGFGSIQFPYANKGDFSTISFYRNREQLFFALTDGKLKKSIASMNVDVDKSKMNIGGYNERLANAGFITTDLNVGQFTHSTTFTVKMTPDFAVSSPVQEIETIDEFEDVTIPEVVEEVEQLASEETPIVTGKEDVQITAEDTASEFKNLFDPNAGSVGVEFKFSVRTTDDYQVFNKEEEIARVKELLPQVPIEVYDSLKEIWSGPEELWGLFKDSMIYLASDAIVGTTYHEAFHAVFNMFLDERRRGLLYKELGKDHPNASELELEEIMAEKFKSFMLSSTDSPNIVYAKEESKLEMLKKFFTWLWSIIKNIFRAGKTTELESLFNEIVKGEFRNVSIPASMGPIARTAKKKATTDPNQGSLFSSSNEKSSTNSAFYSKSINEITNHSGGAIGADSMFDKIGKEFGQLRHNHYWANSKTPIGNVELTKEQLAEGVVHAKAAAKVLGRPWNDKYADLLGRNWYQVKNSTQVIAIAGLIKPGEVNSKGYKSKAGRVTVDGGTGYAVEMGIANGREVNVFDINTNKWYQWNGNSFVPSSVPVLHKNFAGIGSRQDITRGGLMTPESIQAIRNVYSATISFINGPQAVPTQEEAAQETVEDTVTETQALAPYKPIQESSVKIPGLNPRQIKARVTLINSLFLDIIGEIAAREEMAEEKVLKIHSPISIYKKVGARLLNESIRIKEQVAQARASISNLTESQEANLQRYERMAAHYEHALSHFIRVTKVMKESTDEEGNVVTKEKDRVQKLRLMYMSAKALKDYNININIRGGLLEEDYDNAQELEIEHIEDVNKKESWQIGRFETNASDSMSFKIKGILRRLTQRDKDGKPVTDPELGYPLYISFGNIWAYLLRNLNRLENYSQMRDKMLELSDKRPELLQIIDKLAGKEDLQAAFASTLALRKYSFSIVREVERGENLSVEIMSSDRFPSKRLVLDDWKTNLANDGRNSITTNGSIDPAKVTRVKAAFTAIVEAIKVKGELTQEYANLLEDVSQAIGIDLSASDFLGAYTDTEVEGLQISAFKNLLNLLTDPGASLEVIIDYMRSQGNPLTSDANSIVRGSIELLTNVMLESHPEIKTPSFRTVENTTVFMHSLPNFLIRQLERYKSEEVINFYQATPFYMHNQMLQELKEEGTYREKFTMTMLDGYKPQGSKKGIRYSKLNDATLEKIKLAGFFTEEEGYAHYVFPILADAPAMPLLRMKRYNDTDAMDHLYSAAVQEQARIEQVKADHKKWAKEELDAAGDPVKIAAARGKYIENMHYKKGKKGETWEQSVANANGLKFVHFPFMNGVEFTKENFIRLQNQAIKQDMAKEEKRYADLGLAGSFNDIFDWNAGNEITISERYDSDVRAAMNNYQLNVRYANFQMTTLFSGDLAFYKSYDDFTKRNKQVHAPTKLLDTTNIPDVYRSLTLSDSIVRTQHNNSIRAGLIASGTSEAEVNSIMEGYAKINEADAFAYRSPESARDIYIGLGLWNRSRQKAYRRLMAGEGTHKDFELFPPLKPFVFGHLHKDHMIVPTQHKNAEFILFPQIAAQSEVLTKYAKYMKDAGVQQIQFESAVKVGKHNVFTPDQNMDNLRSARPVLLSYSTYGIQQPVPEHHLDSEALFGTQVRKLIMADLDPKGIYMGLPRDEFVKLFNDVITKDLQESYDAVEKHFTAPNGDLDLDAIKTLLMDEVDRRGLSDEIIAALEIERDSTGKFRFVLPLYARLHGDRVESMILSVMESRIIKQKMPGGNLVQMSSYGVSEKLRPPRGMTLYEAARETNKSLVDQLEEGMTADEIQAMRASDMTKYISDKDVYKAIKKYFKEHEKDILPAEVMMPWWSKKYFVGANGEADIEAIRKHDPELLKLIAYRIPTEDKYSMIPMKIVGFLPAEASSVIMIPPELVTMTGGDFDVDKLFFFRRAVKGNKENGTADVVPASMEDSKGRDNYKFDMLWSVLTHPQTYQAMMEGNNFDNWKTLRNEVMKLQGASMETNDPLSPVTYSTYYSAITTGGSLIGIFANQNVNHAVIQHLDVNIGDIRIGTRWHNRFSVVNSADGHRVSKSLGSVLAASVDNVKDPVLGYLNFNTLTADFVALLLRYGVSEKTVSLIMSQPVIKDLTKRFFNEGFDIWKLGKLIDKMREDYPADDSVYKNPAVTEAYLPFSDTQLAQMIEYNTTTALARTNEGVGDDFKGSQKYINNQNDVLTFFSRLSDMVLRANNIIATTRADSAGTGKNLGEMEVRLKAIKDIASNPTIKGMEPLLRGEVYSMIKAFNDYGLKYPFEIMSKIFPYVSPGFVAVKEQLAKILQRELNARELSEINEAYIDWATFQYPWLDLNKADKQKVIRLVASQYVSYTANETFKSNLLIKNLKIDESGELSFYNVGTLSESEKTDISNDWAYLITNGIDEFEEQNGIKVETELNKKIKNWARNLVRYGAYIKGTGFTPNGFMHLVPVSFYKGLVDSTGMSFRDHFSTFEREFAGNHANHGLAFVEQFIRNNPDMATQIRVEELEHEVKTLSGIPSSILVSTASKAYLDGEFTGFINLKYGKKKYLFALAGQNSNKAYYYAIPRLGNDYRSEFSATGPMQTMIDENILRFTETHILSSSNYNYIKDSIKNYPDFFHTEDDLGEDGPPMFQLETKDDRPKNETLNNFLVSYLSRYGISVKATQSLVEEFGKDANAVASFAQKLILISQGKESIDTLPEEFSHFAVRAIKEGDPELYSKLVEAAQEDSSYDKVYNDYIGVYRGDVSKVDEEAVTKLVTTALIKNFEGLEDTKPTSWVEKVLELISQLFDYFRRVFTNAKVDDIHKEVENVFGQVASRILKEEISLSPAQGDDYMLQLASRADNLEKLRKVLKEGLVVITKRAEKFSNVKYSGYDKFSVLQTTIEERLAGDEILGGFLDFYKTATRDIKGVHSRIKKEYEAMQAKDSAPTLEEIKKMASYLRTGLEYVNAYKSTLRGIQFQMSSNPLLSQFKNRSTWVNANADISYSLGIIDSVESYYFEMINPMASTFLSGYSNTAGFVYQAYGDKWVTVSEALQEADKDISFASRFLDSLADSHDGVLQLIDIAVKDYKNRARKEGLDYHKRLVTLFEELQKAGVNDTDFMYERYPDGSISGYLVEEVNYGEFERNKEEFFSQEHTRGEIANWFKVNTQPRKDVLAYIRSRKEEFIQLYGDVHGLEVYMQWIEENTVNTQDDGVVYIKELARPSNIYLSKAYQEIQANPAKAKFHTEFKAIYRELNKKLPDVYRMEERAPQIRKDLWERLRTGAGNRVTTLKNSVQDSLLLTEDESDFGMLDEMNQPVKFVPVHFVKMIGHWIYDYKIREKGEFEDQADYDKYKQDIENKMKKNGKRITNLSDVEMNDRKIKKTPELLSTDLISTTVAFAYMATNYQNMNDIVDILEISKDAVKNRTVPRVNSRMKPIMDKISEKVGLDKPAMSEKPSEAYRRLDEYMNMVVYGQHKEAEGSISFLGLAVDRAKLLDMLGKYTSLSSLALNTYAGISNLAYGEWQIRAEAAAGQYFDHKQLLSADYLYATQVPSLMADMGSLSPKSKIGLVFERLNVFNDYESHVKDIDANRTKAGRLANTSALYFMSKAGEHYMQGTVALAYMLNTKVPVDGGAEITLWDAFEVVDGKLGFKAGVQFDANTELRWTLNLQQLNNNLHGIYNETDKSVIQKYAIGRLAVMFRKFIRPGFLKRWGHKKRSEITNSMSEGQYITFGKFIKSAVSDLTHLKAVWSSLEDYEKQNVMRTLTELGGVLAMFALMAIITNLSGDDDEDWALNMLAYQAERMNSELQFYANPIEALKILKSPSASITQIERVIKLLGSLNPLGDGLHVIERGSWEGTTELERNFWQMVPLAKTLHDLKNPYEKKKFFQL